jgi:hypothetical protein
MLRIRVWIGLIAAALVVPAAALAQRPASRSERAAIVGAAVHQGEISSTQGACVSVNISTVNQGYAVLTWPSRLSKACTAVAANGTIVEQKSGASWILTAAGSSFACPLKTVPAAVARDLGICSNPAAAPRTGRSNRPRRAARPA